MHVEDMFVQTWRQYLSIIGDALEGQTLENVGAIIEKFCRCTRKPRFSVLAIHMEVANL
jgi:hypothetical protein